MIHFRKVDQASKMAARWLVKSCQITDTADPNLGAFKAEYDLAERRFTLSPQTWRTSEAIRALLKIHGRTRNQSLKDAAILGGRYLESIQCPEDEGDNAGSLWKPWLDGSELLFVDTNYRSIVGLLDLYGATGALHYLDASKRIADWFQRVVYRGGGTHLNRYFPDKKVLGWPRSHILDEGSFLRLQDLTREEVYTRVFEDQMEALVSSSGSDGTFSCMSTPRMERDPDAQPGEISSRSMYWHLISMVMAQTKLRDSRVMKVLEDGARLGMDLQSTEGFLSRTYKTEEGGKENGVPDGVATAMFVLIWLKLLDISGEEIYMEHSEHALSWMLKSQFLARRESYLGAFFQEMVLYEGKWHDIRGSLSSSYGVMACEEYLRLCDRK